MAKWRNSEIAKETFSLDVNHCNVLRRFMFADFFRLFLAFIPIIMYLCIDLKLGKWQKWRQNRLEK